MFKYADIWHWHKKALEAARNRMKRLQSTLPKIQNIEEDTKKLHDTFRSMLMFSDPKQSYSQLAATGKQRGIQAPAKHPYLSILDSPLINRWIHRNYKHPQLAVYDPRIIAAEKANERRTRSWLYYIFDLGNISGNGVVYDQPPKVGLTNARSSGTIPWTNQIGLKQNQYDLYTLAHQMAHIFDRTGRNFKKRMKLDFDPGAQRIHRQLKASFLGLKALQQAGLADPAFRQQGRKSLHAAYKTYKYSDIANLLQQYRKLARLKARMRPAEFPYPDDYPQVKAAHEKALRAAGTPTGVSAMQQYTQLRDSIQKDITRRKLLKVRYDRDRQWLIDKLKRRGLAIPDIMPLLKD